MIPDAVVGHAGVGGQQRPQQAQFAVVVFLAQAGAETPKCQQGATGVDAVASALYQAFHVVEATSFEVVQLGVAEPTTFAQIELGAAQRVDQHRAVGPAHLRPISDLKCFGAASLGLHRDLLHRPLRTIGGSRPPVSAFDGFVSLFGQAVLEHGAVQDVEVIGVDMAAGAAGFPAHQARHGAAGSAFVACGVAQQHQGLFGRVMQPGVQFDFPEGVSGHE